MAGRPGVGTEDDGWDQTGDEELIDRLLAAAEVRDVAADRRDRAASARDAAAFGDAASGDDAGPAVRVHADERGQNALDRAWAGRDRDAAAMDRAELIELGRRAAARADGRHRARDPLPEVPEPQAAAADPPAHPAPEAAPPAARGVPVPGGRGRQGRGHLVGASTDQPVGADEDAENAAAEH